MAAKRRQALSAPVVEVARREAQAALKTQSYAKQSLSHSKQGSAVPVGPVAVSSQAGGCKQLNCELPNSKADPGVCLHAASRPCACCKLLKSVNGLTASYRARGTGAVAHLPRLENKLQRPEKQLAGSSSGCFAQVENLQEFSMSSAGWRAEVALPKSRLLSL